MLFTQKKILLICVACILLGLSSCREVEQNRPITEKKGLYEGPADTALDQETLRKLRNRGAAQKF